MDEQKQKGNLNRFSEEFVYDSNCEKHIGKRTGNLYRRVCFQQHFDGFPRFSQYESHHLPEYSSLANSKKMDLTILDSDRQRNLSKQKWREQSKNKKKIHEDGEEEKKQLWGKKVEDLQEFISTIIKNKSSTQLVTSQRGDYIKLLKAMENNEDQSFVFKEQGFQDDGQLLIGSQIKWRNANEKKQKTRVTFYENVTYYNRNVNETQYEKKDNEESGEKKEKQWEKQNKFCQKNQEQKISTMNKEVAKQGNEKKKKQKRKRSQQRAQLAQMKCSSKYCILTQQKQYIKELYSQEKQAKQNDRYPKRMRMKPVQFWENEKVQYKGGKVVKIERSTLNMKSLICTNEAYRNKININIATHNIEIQVKIPGKKQLSSSGISDIYQRLQISLTHELEQKLQHQQVYYQDVFKRQSFVYGQSIIVDRLISFQIHNRTKKPVTFLMTLIVKNA